MCGGRIHASRRILGLRAGSFPEVVAVAGDGDRARRPVAELLGRTSFLFSFAGWSGYEGNFGLHAVQVRATNCKKTLHMGRI